MQKFEEQLMDQPLRILFVEDSPLAVNLLVHELHLGGFNCVFQRVETSEAMTRALIDKVWDLVIADFVLPNFSGMAALELVKANGIDVPFIMVSGQVGEDILIDSIKAGANSYILKSNLKRLVPAVQREFQGLLKRQRARENLCFIETSYRNLIEQIPAITYIAAVDEHRTITYISPQIKSLLGFTARQWMDDPYLWLQQVYPEDREIVTSALIQAKESSYPYFLEYRMITSRNQIVWIRDGAVIIADKEQDCLSLKGIIIDISEFKEAERQIQQQMQMLGTLYVGSQKLSESLNPQQVAQDIVFTSVNIFGGCLAWLAQSGSDGGMHLLTHYPIESESLKEIFISGDNTISAMSGPLDRAFRTGFPVVFDLDLTTKFFQLINTALNKDLKTGVAIPLISCNTTFGLLTICSDQKGFFTEEQVEFFQAYVQLASAALYNAQLFVQIQNHANELEARVRERTVQLESVNQELQKSQEALQELAIRDALTGLFNRREMERLLDEEMERQHRSKNTFSVSLIMLDIDHFKKINDTYGHQAGDAILQSLGKILIASTRQLDRVARFGGEEFVIIAPEISKNDVYSMAERLRNIVANHQFLISEGNGLATTIPVTISLGLASIPTDADSKSGLLKGADQALYEAKHRGRNQVIAFADIK